MAYTSDVTRDSWVQISAAAGDNNIAVQIDPTRDEAIIFIAVAVATPGTAVEPPVGAKAHALSRQVQGVTLRNIQAGEKVWARCAQSSPNGRVLASNSIG